MKKLTIFLISAFLVSNTNQLFCAAISSQDALNSQSSLSLDESTDNSQMVSLPETDVVFKYLTLKELEQEDDATKKLWEILRKNINENNKITDDYINIQSVKEAIDSGAKLNIGFQPVAEKSIFFSPLEIAINANNLELTKLFLDSAKGLIAQNYKSKIFKVRHANNVIDRAVPMSSELQLKMYELFFERYPELIKELEDKNALDNLTGFYERDPNPALFDLVIRYGANINIIRSGYTPLMHAATMGRSKMITALLKAGADVYFQHPNSFYITFFDLIKELPYEEAREAYYESFNEPTKQLWEILKNNVSYLKTGNQLTVCINQNKVDIKAVQEAIDSGADLNSVYFIGEDDNSDSFIYTPLHIAIEANNFELTKLFLDSNSKNFKIINMPNALGDTPLMIATLLCNADMVKALLHAGADVNIKNKAGKTFFTRIAREKFENIKKAYDEFLASIQARKSQLMEAMPTFPADLVTLINQYEYFQKPTIVQDQVANQANEDVNLDSNESPEK